MSAAGDDVPPLVRDYMEFLAHPKFEAALYKFAADGVRHFLKHHTMRRYSKDMASFYAGSFAVFLYFTERGLTATSFTETCARTGVCSPGRAASILAYMRARSDVTTEKGSEGKRMRRLVPSPTLISFFAERTADQMGTLAMMSPEAEAALPRLADEAFRTTLLRGSGEMMLADLGVYNQSSESNVLEFFGRRNAGFNILFSIFSPHPDQPLAGTPFKVSVSGLAANLGVSRPHVLKMFRDGDAAKLITWDEEGRVVTFGEELANALRALFASVLVATQGSLRHVLAAEAAGG